MCSITDKDILVHFIVNTLSEFNKPDEKTYDETHIITSCFCFAQPGRNAGDGFREIDSMVLAPWNADFLCYQASQCGPQTT